MSSRTLAQSKVADRTYPAKISTVPWVRPADWLTLPTLTDSDQKFIGLHAVYPDSNFLALSAAGNYTVNWGDGLTENFSTGVVAYHQYDYTNSALTGTDCSRGYKQAIVTVTPQGGQNLTTLNLHKKHNQTGLSKYSSGFLDIVIAGSLLTSLLIGAATAGSATQTIRFANLEQVVLYSNAVASFSYIFNTCYSLVSIPDLYTNSCTNFSQAFNTCNRLQRVPLFNLSACTNFSSAFFGCASLQSVPQFNLDACTDFSSAFANCYSLQSVPLFNLSACTNFSSAFNGTCTQLAKSDIMNCKYSIDYSICKLSQTALETIITNLGKAAGAQTITINSNWGAPTPISLSGTSTAGSNTITMASTTGITAGMQVTGTGSPLTTALACTLQGTPDTVTATAHGLSNGDLVSFATLVTTTGIATYTPYYVVNAATDTFQLALTAGGSAINLTNDGSGTLLYRATIVTVNTNVSVVLDRKMTASGTATFAYRLLNTGLALQKGWTVSG